jgi:hypothetical protein
MNLLETLTTFEFICWVLLVGIGLYFIGLGIAYIKWRYIPKQYEPDNEELNDDRE